MSSGRQGELLFQQRMEQRGYIVQDVTDNEDFWSRDIDFIVTSPYTGETKSFEVKWDSKVNRTNNLYLELASAHSPGGVGWYQFCKADYLAYGDSVTESFFIIKMDELRKRAEKLPKRYGQCGSESIGQLVSLSKIADIVEVL